MNRPRTLNSKTCFLPFLVSSLLAVSIAVGSDIVLREPPGKPVTNAFAVRIVVNAGQAQGELAPIWRFFGADEPNYATMPNGRKLLAELGTLAPQQIYFRAHNLLTSGDGTPALKWGSTGVYDEDADGSPHYRWTILDGIFDTYLQNGVRPYVEIGFMPKALSTKPEPYQHHWTPDEPYTAIFTGWAYPPKDYHKWGDMVFNWTRHCVERYGRPEVESWFWEVWNEPNIGYWRGTPQEFLELHDYAIAGVRRALPTARVGGADTAGSGGQFTRTFLEHCLHGTNFATGKVGTPLDFISFHAKGAPIYTNGHVRMGISAQLRTIDEGFRIIASFPELKDKPVVIGESDPEGCAACQGPSLEYRNGTMYSSYTAASVAREYDLAQKYGIPLEGVLTWAFEFEDQPFFAGFRSLASNGIDKPVLNVFRLFSQMTGQRLPVESDMAMPLEPILRQGVRGQPDVGALATRGRQQVCVLVWHYHDDDLPGPPARVTLVFEGLPVRSGLATLEHFRIDEDHSNAFVAWKRMGAPQQPSPEQYAQLERAGQLAALGPSETVPVAEKKATIDFSLPRQGVSLLRLDFAGSPGSSPGPTEENRPGGEVDKTHASELARYVCVHEKELPASVVKEFVLGWCDVEKNQKAGSRWLFLQATKASGERFGIWLLTDGYPPDTVDAAAKRVRRFVIQRGNSEPLEFREQRTGQAVLPAFGGWRYLLPRSAESDRLPTPLKGYPKRTEYLGHIYGLISESQSAAPPVPPNVRVIELLPDVLVGVASNTRQEEQTRRYDGSDYKLRRLTSADYREMADAGINCVRVDAEQRRWIEDLAVFYWGVGGQEVPYPECFYDSRYLGPQIFIDEPAVHTRDYVIRPRLGKERLFRKALTPEVVFEAFRETVARDWQEGAPVALLQGLAARPDVDLGDMKFHQANLFSWETMVSTAAYQLSQDPEVPRAMVFEPPGRVSRFKTLPEFDMTYGCQIPVDDPKNLDSIIYGFLRGAARLTAKQWGTSIYGAVDRADAPWFLTHAYDLGATRFFFWDNAGLACVPYEECLGLAHQLKMRAENRPNRDLDQLRRAAEVVILLPPGYDLGHVQLGRGSLWGLGELNLERTNRAGITYREVMGNFFTEIERCLRLGVAFDLLWDLPGIQPLGYRESVSVREDGKVEVTEGGTRSVLDHARAPVRPRGLPPILEVTLSTNQGSAPVRISARARVSQTSAPVYYTLGTDESGIYHNAAVAWELFGPGEEDYRSLTPPGLKPQVMAADGKFEAVIEFGVNEPGKYRLRTATVDIAGRSTVHWTSINVSN